MEARALMAVLISLMIFLLDQDSTCQAARAHPRAAGPTNFLRSSCSRVTYPHVCLDSLSHLSGEIQASPAQLAVAALSVSLVDAKSTAFALSGVRPSGENGAVQDCVAMMADAVAKIEKSLATMQKLGEKHAGVQVGNMQAWLSAALTDENMCMVGFDAEGGARGKVRAQVEKAAQLTCNALSMINGLAAQKKP